MDSTSVEQKEITESDCLPQKSEAEMPGLAEGRIVHYVLEAGAHRPAIVVKNWHTPGGCCNLQVFLDGVDAGLARADIQETESYRGITWRASVLHSVEPVRGTWHWPEKA